jgi:hypothetical protein
MIELLRLILHIIASLFKPRAKLVAEILVVASENSIRWSGGGRTKPHPRNAATGDAVGTAHWRDGFSALFGVSGQGRTPRSTRDQTS